MAVELIVVCVAIAVGIWIIGARFKEITNQFSNFGVSLKSITDDYSKISNLLTNPAGLKTIGEKNLEFLLDNILPSHLVCKQQVIEGVGIVDTAIRIGDKIIPIDSKFPKWTPDAKALASAVKDRVKEAAKYVHPGGGTTDFALMYVHSELIYAKTFMENDELLQFAMDHKVVPVSPSTIYLYLTTLMDAEKRVEFSKDSNNILENIKSTIGKFEASKLSVDKANKQLRDALANIEVSSKKIQDSLDVLNKLTGEKNE